MRRAAAVLALVALALPGAARADDLPAGKVGVFSGLRQNRGALGDQYGFGLLFLGVDAHYQPTRLGQSFALGLAWSTLLWTRFGADDASSPTRVLSPIEMSLGLRLRRSLSDRVPRFLVATAGGTILRTNVPVPPADDRLYLGGYAGLALEEYLLGTWLFTIEARYALIGPDVPTSASVLFGVGWGSR